MVQAAVDSSKKLHPFFVKGATETTPSFEPTHDDDSNSEPSDGEGHNRRKPDISAPQGAPEPKKKRRRKNGGASIDGTILNHLSRPVNGDPTISHHVSTPPPSNVSATPTDVEPPISHSAPAKAKKVLKFNPKTGTLGSPPKPKSPPSRIVSIKYGRDEESRRVMGEKIQHILDGTWQPSTPTKKRTRAPRKSKEVAPVQDTKTHPFFGGKPKPQEKTEAPKKSPRPRNSIFMSTPVSPRKPRIPFGANKLPQFGMKPTGTKVPGAMLPLWPALGMSHVRGDVGTPIMGHATLSRPARKFKGQIVSVTREESVLRQLVDRLDLGRVRETLPRDEDAFDPAPAELRLPTRHFESGRKLERRIRSQLRAYVPSAAQCSQDDLEQPKVHPAISRFYDSLETRLSAFDRSTCEGMAWTHKYAPVAASQLLQAGKEGFLLRQWLEALKVQSVDTGDAGKSKSKPEAVKKKRKKNKLDGFVVDSDDEATEMDEVSEDEADWAPAGPGRINKTVIRSGSKAKEGRLTNAVVLSGPHGSGKTAAVYAVAKELGFEVFEINSSSRRSGKDILEKVGDMTRNHLVQQHRAEEGAEAVEDDIANDIKSGTQGTMTAFFQPKAEPKPKEFKPKKDVKLEEVKNHKAQKQSLILLEEVDILYDEDKQFWATLMTLILQSKRPFIMTCNDESIVPLQSLSLHGILRFSPPPVDLAVDLGLLIAANEGHALQRAAVEALYDARGNDLRATITDLNYWCQLGIGDRRGGFDWFYLRWPRGSDLDEHSDVVRVVSENTYEKGMGWFGRDLIATAPERVAEEEAMRQSWDSWQLDMGDWHGSMNMGSWAGAVSTGKSLPTLEAYDEFCTSMSDADLCSSSGFTSSLRELIDPTVPDLPVKTRDDFILGRTLLEATPLVRQASPSVAISISIKSLARADLLALTQRIFNTPELHPATETKAIDILHTSFTATSHQLTRHDISIALDPIASDKPPTGTLLDPSVLDRTLTIIVEDVAPWVRGIVHYDHRLMQERLKLSNLLSEGGSGKRKRAMRTTRSAWSALEGGERRTTRRERYFGDVLVTGFVMRTGGEWMDAVQECKVEGGSLGGDAESPRSEDELS